MNTAAYGGSQGLGGGGAGGERRGAGRLLPTAIGRWRGSNVTTGLWRGFLGRLLWRCCRASEVTQ